MYRNLNKLSHNGKILTHAGGGYQEGNIVSQFFVGGETSNHYRVYWNLEEFLKQHNDGTYDWPYPTHRYKIEDEEKKEDVLKYYANNYKLLNKTVYRDGEILRVIYTPKEFQLLIGDVIHESIATDEGGNVYKIFWNMLNILKPEKIELTVNNSKYCKKCLTRWTNKTNNDACQHEWVDA